MLFSLRLHGVVVFIHKKENWQPVAGPGSVFPSFCHATFQHALIMHMLQCIPCGVHCLMYHDRDTFDFSQGHACDQESANSFSCLVEWKSRNITSCFVPIFVFEGTRLTFWNSNLQGMVAMHSQRFLKFLTFSRQM